MPDIFQQLCCRRDQIWDGMRQLFHFIILIGFDLFHLLFYFLRFFTVRCRFDADTFRFGQMYIVQVFEIAVIASVIPDTFSTLRVLPFFPQDEHITATEQAATINPILHIIFFIIFLLAETKVTKISLISKYL